MRVSVVCNCKKGIHTTIYMKPVLILTCWIIVIIIIAIICENNEFGTSGKYILFDNIACTGTDSSIAGCQLYSLILFVFIKYQQVKKA